MPRIVIGGYKFYFDENGVYPVGKRINFADIGYLDAAKGAIEECRRFRDKQTTYVYIFGSQYRNVVKIGVSGNPNRRFNDCYGATDILNTVRFDYRAMAFRYEAALHQRFSEHESSKHGVRISGIEWFILHCGQIQDLVTANSEAGLCKAMGLLNKYEDAAINGETFDPTCCVEVIPFDAYEYIPTARTNTMGVMWTPNDDETATADKT